MTHKLRKPKGPAACKRCGRTREQLSAFRAPIDAAGYCPPCSLFAYAEGFTDPNAADAPEVPKEFLGFWSHALPDREP